jgi:hypothetical protein
MLGDECEDHSITYSLPVPGINGADDNPRDKHYYAHHNMECRGGEEPQYAVASMAWVDIVGGSGGCPSIGYGPYPGLISKVSVVSNPRSQILTARNGTGRTCMEAFLI